MKDSRKLRSKYERHPPIDGRDQFRSGLSYGRSDEEIASARRTIDVAGFKTRPAANNLAGEVDG
jgi:hypothetical protein